MVVKMYNPKTNILVETSKNFVNRWILLGFIRLPDKDIRYCKTCS